MINVFFFSGEQSLVRTNTAIDSLQAIGRFVVSVVAIPQFDRTVNSFRFSFCVYFASSIDSNWEYFIVSCGSIFPSDKFSNVHNMKCTTTLTPDKLWEWKIVFTFFFYLFAMRRFINYRKNIHFCFNSECSVVRSARKKKHERRMKLTESLWGYCFFFSIFSGNNIVTGVLQIYISSFFSTYKHDDNILWNYYWRYSELKMRWLSLSNFK